MAVEAANLRCVSCAGDRRHRQAAKTNNKTRTPHAAGLPPKPKQMACAALTLAFLPTLLLSACLNPHTLSSFPDRPPLSPFLPYITLPFLVPFPNPPLLRDPRLALMST